MRERGVKNRCNSCQRRPSAVLPRQQRLQQRIAVHGERVARLAAAGVGSMGDAGLCGSGRNSCSCSDSRGHRDEVANQQPLRLLAAPIDGCAPLPRMQPTRCAFRVMVLPHGRIGHCIMRSSSPSVPFFRREVARCSMRRRDAAATRMKTRRGARRGSHPSRCS